MYRILVYYIGTMQDNCCECPLRCVMEDFCKMWAATWLKRWVRRLFFIDTLYHTCFNVVLKGLRSNNLEDKLELTIVGARAPHRSSIRIAS